MDEYQRDSDTAGETVDPDDLELTENEYVQQLDENRFVVSADEPFDASTSPATPTGHRTTDTVTPDDSFDGSRFDGVTTHEQSSDPAADSSLRVHLESQLSSSDAQHGFDLAVKFDDETATRRFRSDDLVTTFERLVEWLCTEVDAETPPSAVLGILLLESDLAVTYPTESVGTLLDAHDLDPDDTIADLFAALGGDGFVFPPDDSRVRRP